MWSQDVYAEANLFLAESQHPIRTKFLVPVNPSWDEVNQRDDCCCTVSSERMSPAKHDELTLEAELRRLIEEVETADGFDEHMNKKCMAILNHPAFTPECLPLFERFLGRAPTDPRTIKPINRDASSCFCLLFRFSG